MQHLKNITTLLDVYVGDPSYRIEHSGM